MPNLSPSTKRKRSSGENNTKSSKISKSKYWFEDGNVIIQVEKTRFRVHRSLLSRHSSVLEGIFNNPKPREIGCPNREVDGCPVIHLTDTAREFEHIMSIFYDNLRDHDMRMPMPFDDLAAIIRLGKKYDIGHLMDEGLRRLRAEFPDNLVEWDNLNAIHPGQQISENLQFYQNAMTLAYELSMDTVLPAICLMCIQTVEVKDIIKSLQEASPTEDTLRYTSHLLEACLEARDEILCRVQSTYLGWIRSNSDTPIPAANCSATTSCAAFKAEAITALPELDGFRKITAMDYNELPSEMEDYLCEECIDSLKRAILQFRADVWGDLPSLFKIGSSWATLKDFEP